MAKLKMRGVRQVGSKVVDGHLVVTLEVDRDEVLRGREDHEPRDQGHGDQDDPGHPERPTLP